jgi:aminoglycoside phosphotransferase family enzyme/predicted kinase
MKSGVGAADGVSHPQPGSQDRVFAFLGDPRTYGIADPVKRIDTHGAIVFLAGADAYKIKRAARFSFMDLSTLEQRRAACEAEVAINRANAPDIYLGAVAIARDGDALRFGGDGTVVEWAVHMRRFDENMTFDRLALEGELPPALVEKLARTVLASHARALMRRDADTAEAFRSYIRQNDETFATLPRLIAPAHAARLREAQLATLCSRAPLLAQRSRDGYVRRGHGDLHLRNVVLIGDKPVLFDAVEFDENIATVDVLYDLAFLLMDLEGLGLRLTSNHLLNAYLAPAAAPALDGLAALPLFLSLRAALRAKVAGLRAALVDTEQRVEAENEVRDYFELAERLLQHQPPRLVAVGGLSGSGKTTVSRQLAPLIGSAPGALHLRSDVERKLRFGVADEVKLPEQAYKADISAEIYATLRDKAAHALRAGHAVIVDGVSQRQEDRASFEDIARRCSVPFSGLWLDAPADQMIARVASRTGDASDANARIVRQQLAADTGPIAWPRIDGGAAPTVVLDRARRTLGI